MYQGLYLVVWTRWMDELNCIKSNVSHYAAVSITGIHSGYCDFLGFV